MAADVIAIRPGVLISEDAAISVSRNQPEPPPCAVCGSSEALLYESWSCDGDGCDCQMHGACYWGRVATIGEWKDYLERWIKPEQMPHALPSVLCPACRANGGVA